MHAKIALLLLSLAASPALAQSEEQLPREEARNRAEAAQATAIQEANIRQRRLKGGSRFNIWYELATPHR